MAEMDGGISSRWNQAHLCQPASERASSHMHACASHRPAAAHQACPVLAIHPRHSLEQSAGLATPLSVATGTAAARGRGAEQGMGTRLGGLP